MKSIQYAMQHKRIVVVLSVTDSALEFYYWDRPREQHWVPLQEMAVPGQIPILDAEDNVVAIYDVKTRVAIPLQRRKEERR